MIQIIVWHTEKYENIWTMNSDWSFTTTNSDDKYHFNIQPPQHILQWICRGMVHANEMQHQNASLKSYQLRLRCHLRFEPPVNLFPLNSVNNTYMVGFFQIFISISHPLERGMKHTPHDGRHHFWLNRIQIFWTRMLVLSSATMLHTIFCIFLLQISSVH